MAVAVALVPGRGHLDTADNALVLVVAIVAVASTGRRAAAVVAALASALAFDFFLTLPTARSGSPVTQDLVTEVLLLVVGLAVGELAARGRRHRDAASERTASWPCSTRSPSWPPPDKIRDCLIAVASDGLQQLLSLRDCRLHQT